MSAGAEDVAPGARELVLSRRLDASPAAVWRCWTEPALLTRWFTPAPWRTVAAEVDLRPGGIFATTMRGPDGREFANLGVFLEVARGRRLVFTDAYAPGWLPADQPFMTAIVDLAEEGGGTAYRARALHWTEEARDRHAAMGFHAGWSGAADQLEALARGL